MTQRHGQSSWLRAMVARMACQVKVIFDVSQGQWRDLHDETKPLNQYGVWPMHDGVEWMGADMTALTFARLPGTIKDTGGAAACIIRADRGDGTTVLIETSLSAFIEAARMLAALDDVEHTTTNILKGL